MSELFICEKCGKTLEVNGAKDVLFCPVCSTSYSTKELIDGKRIIDKESESHDYNFAMTLYEKGDYSEAARYFEKVVFLNRNNHYAQYYLAICNILSGRTYLSTGELISEMVLNSFYALFRSGSGGDRAEAFQFSVINQAAAFVKDLIGRLNETTDLNLSSYRQNGLFLAKNIRKMFAVDFSDSSERVKQKLLEIITSMLRVISKSIEPRLEGGKVDMATAEELSLGRSLGTSYYNYALSIDEYFVPGDINHVMEKTFQMNNELYGKIFEIKKGAPKRFAAIDADDNELTLFNEKINALKISYCTCFRGLGIPVDERKRHLLVEQTFEIILSSLSPRIVINNSGDAEIRTLTVDTLRIISSYYMEFVKEMARTSEYKLNSSLDSFYRALYVNTFNYFSIMRSNFDRLGEIIRSQKNKELHYLRSFFYSVVCVSDIATLDFMPYSGHSMEYRKRILKMGSEASEAFLYLYNYNLEAVERSVHYRDLYSIANTIENDLKRM